MKSDRICPTASKSRASTAKPQNSRFMVEVLLKDVKKRVHLLRQRLPARTPSAEAMPGRCACCLAAHTHWPLLLSAARYKKTADQSGHADHFPAGARAQ